MNTYRSTFIALFVGLLIGAFASYVFLANPASIASKVADAVVQKQAPQTAEMIAAIELANAPEIDPQIVEDLTNVAQEQASKISGLESSLSAERARSSALDAARQSAETAVENNASTLERLISERNQLKASVDVSAQEIARLKQAGNQLAQVATERDRLQTQVETLSAELDTEKARAQSENAGLSAQLKAQVTALQNERRKDAATLRAIRDRATQAESNLAEAQKTLQTLEGAAGELAQITNQRNQLALRVEQLQTSNQAEREKGNSLSEQLAALSQSASTAQQDAERALTQARDTITSLRTEIANTPEPIDPAVIAERDALAKDRDALAQERDALRVDRQALTGEINRQKTEIAEISERYNAVVSQYNSLADVYNKLLERVNAGR